MLLPYKTACAFGMSFVAVMIPDTGVRGYSRTRNGQRRYVPFIGVILNCFRQHDRFPLFAPVRLAVLPAAAEGRPTVWSMPWRMACWSVAIRCLLDWCWLSSHWVQLYGWPSATALSTSDQPANV